VNDCDKIKGVTENPKREVRRLRPFITTTILFVFLSCISLAQAAPQRRIVVFDQAINEPAREALVKAVGGVILRDLPLISGKAVLLPPQAEAALKAMPGVRRIDPDVTVEALGKPSKPGKPEEPQPQETLPWGVDRIDAELVWDTYTGEGVKVAVLDTGIDLDHPDLQANIAGGVNIINPKRPPDDDNGHGTHVAGIIAAVDNEIGVIGVGPQISLYAVKVLNRRGWGFLSDVIAGIEWCIENGMHVINMSFGTSSDVGSFHDAVRAAYDAGIVQVAAAGNEYGGSVLYPAAYDEVIAVSATDQSDEIADFSSVGPEVELSAPGVDIPSTWKGGGYETASGTSMAAPHVTGAAALVISSGTTGVDNVRSKLQITADDLGDPGRDELYGYGLVDAKEAATGAETSLAPRLPIALTWGSLSTPYAEFAESYWLWGWGYGYSSQASP